MDWKSIIETIFMAIITGAVSYSAKYIVPQAVTWLKNKAEQLALSIENATLSNYIELAVDAVADAVVEVNQTFVEELKKSDSFDDLKKSEAFDKAKTVALSLMSENAKKAITQAFGDLETWLKTKIEVIVNVKKNVNG